EIGNSLFRLEGKSPVEADQQFGPLFCGHLPRLCGNFTNVKTIVVGEEGRAKNRWRKGFNLASGNDHWDIPEEITSFGHGWYFLRMYDAADELIDSLDFRFIEGLEEIEEISSLGETLNNQVKACRVSFRCSPEINLKPCFQAPELERSVSGAATTYEWCPTAN